MTVQIVVPFFYVGWVACLAQLVAGCLVLPSLARQDLRGTAANLIQVHILPEKAAYSPALPRSLSCRGAAFVRCFPSPTFQAKSWNECARRSWATRCQLMQATFWRISLQSAVRSGTSRRHPMDCLPVQPLSRTMPMPLTVHHLPLVTL